ncbi:glycosyl hydrolase family 76-domain-containing protein [Xylariomycetidae sp. FL0641]|nr:glycosyl hydrolase family 76-domain-containing protein [Xylariomycetidae sp. FL0641]
MRFAWRNAAVPPALLLIFSHLGSAAYYDLDVDSTDSIKSTSKTLAQDLMSMYTGNEKGQVPGLLPQPYYWWEAGALMGAMVDYWYYTGDTTYNDITQQGLLFQVGPDNDYMPPNQTLTEGNDDQGFWGMAVMSAAEYNFQNPPANKPQWLALAQAVFNTQAARWDTQHCNGGLRWQIFTWNNGFDYKNTISQACLFNVAARLALYTGNSSYAEWATRVYEWTEGVKLIAEDYRVYDGVHIGDNCSSITPYEFSYNVGAFLLGAAAMVEYTNKTGQTSETAIWSERVDGMLNSTEEIFFYGNNTDDKVMIEIACEPVNLCDVDQQSFKAYLSRWMAATTKWAPWTFDRIKRLLANSATAAVQQCTGGDNGRMCGLKWANNSGQWDGTTGVGQQMAVMEVVLANMIQEASAPVTNSTGGTSAGNPAAGGSDDGRYDSATYHFGKIDDGDRAGAAIATFFVLAGLLAAVIFMCADETRSARDNWDSAVESFSDFKEAPVPTLLRVIGRGPHTTATTAVVEEKGKQPEVLQLGGNTNSSSDDNSAAKVAAAYDVIERPTPSPTPSSTPTPIPAAAAAVAAASTSRRNSRKRLSKPAPPSPSPSPAPTTATGTAPVNDSDEVPAIAVNPRVRELRGHHKRHSMRELAPTPQKSNSVLRKQRRLSA